MSKKIYVGNLPYEAGEESVREAFERFGEILSVKIITDESGRSKGFGFIEMVSDNEAEKAIAELNGTSFMGRNIVVNEARPQTDRGRRDGSGRAKRPSGRGRESGRWR